MQCDLFMVQGVLWKRDEQSPPKSLSMFACSATFCSAQTQEAHMKQTLLTFLRSSASSDFQKSTIPSTILARNRDR